MSIKAGLVGLPNVGKSTLFNALTNSSVPAANYPFCTIDPHLALTNVPDPRIEKLVAAYKSGKTVPATVQFVDIAGLVQGAASGAGLGNQFLSHIREVDLILHVLRCFDDPDITYSRDEVDPLIDYEIIMTELMLKDLDSVQKRVIKVAQLIKQSKSQPTQLKELEAEAELLTKLEASLNSQNLENARVIAKEPAIKHLSLLCAKNFLIIANLSEQEVEPARYQKNRHYQKLLATFGHDRVIPISARLEYELSQLPEEEAASMATMMGLASRGLDHIIRSTYEHLGLITFFTCGPKEIHAWPIPKGLTVRQAAGEIHSDLERGFICAEVFNCSDLFSLSTEAKVRDAGKMRTEGADYLVRDGDILSIRFNV